MLIITANFWRIKKNELLIVKKCILYDYAYTSFITEIEITSIRFDGGYSWFLTINHNNSAPFYKALKSQVPVVPEEKLSGCSPDVPGFPNRCPGPRTVYRFPEWGTGSPGPSISKYTLYT